MEWLLGAAKALVAGIVTGGAGVAILLDADPELVAAIAFVLTPLSVYLTRNKPKTA